MSVVRKAYGQVACPGWESQIGLCHPPYQTHPTDAPGGWQYLTHHDASTLGYTGYWGVPRRPSPTPSRSPVGTWGLGTMGDNPGTVNPRHATIEVPPAFVPLPGRAQGNQMTRELKEMVSHEFHPRGMTGGVKSTFLF